MTRAVEQWTSLTQRVEWSVVVVVVRESGDLIPSVPSVALRYPSVPVPVLLYPIKNPILDPSSKKDKV